MLSELDGSCCEDSISIHHEQAKLAHESKENLYDQGMEIKDWVRAARNHAKKTQQQLGEAVGRTKANVGHWENGLHEPSWDMIRSIAHVTGYPLPSDAATPPNMELAGQVSAGRPVVVVGHAKLGSNGYYEEISSTPGAGDGTVEAYSDDPSAYALRVKGDSMFPAIRNGWYVVVEPHKRPSPGDYVLVKMGDGQKMVKELLMYDADTVTVMSVNGGERMTIQREELDNHFSVQTVVSLLSPSQWRP